MMVRELVKPPLWFWIVAVLALLWSAIGCWAYLSQVTMDAADLARLPPAEREAWAVMPDWVKGVYAVGVWIGLAASIALLLRRSIARPLFIVSLVAVIVQFGFVFASTRILETIGPSALGLPLTIIALGAFLIWFSGHAIKRGWIG